MNPVAGRVLSACGRREPGEILESVRLPISSSVAHRILVGLIDRGRDGAACRETSGVTDRTRVNRSSYEPLRDR